MVGNRTKERIQRMARKGKMLEQKIEINALDFFKELGRYLHGVKRMMEARLPQEEVGAAPCWCPGMGASLLWVPATVHGLGPRHDEAEYRVYFPFCSICLRAKRAPIFFY